MSPSGRGAEMRSKISLIITATGLAALAGCGAETKRAPAGPHPAAPVALETTPPVSGVRTITLPSPPPDLPEGPGRQAVIGRCVVCHSPRYITMQPLFSRTVWTTEVDKMRKTFGAPVADEQVEDI